MYIIPKAKAYRGISKLRRKLEKTGDAGILASFVRQALEKEEVQKQKQPAG